MAFSTRPFFFFFFLLSAFVFSSLQIHARESHFFSKLPRGSPNDQNPSFATVDPKKEQENQDPSFVPQSGNGYGLYGHETSYNNNNVKYEENAKYEPYTTPSLSQTEEGSNYNPKNSENNYYSYRDENKKNKYYNYRNENNKMGEKKNDKYYDNNYNYNTNAAYEEENEPQGFTNNNNFERQGMSDTRFMEKGNYFYDINDETNHGQYYAKNQYKPDRYGQKKVNINGGRFYGNYNNDNSFRGPYESRWEKNTMMNNNEQQEFGEEQEDQFVP